MKISDIRDSAANSIGSPRVEIFITTYCGWCGLAQELLTTNRIPFKAIDVTGASEARSALLEKANGRRTVPVVFIDGQPLGGYEELADKLATGDLDHLKSVPRAA